MFSVEMRSACGLLLAVMVGLTTAQWSSSEQEKRQVLQGGLGQLGGFSDPSADPRKRKLIGKRQFAGMGGGLGGLGNGGGGFGAMNGFGGGFGAGGMGAAGGFSNGMLGGQGMGMGMGLAGQGMGMAGQGMGAGMGAGMGGMPGMGGGMGAPMMGGQGMGGGMMGGQGMGMGMGGGQSFGNPMMGPQGGMGGLGGMGGAMQGGFGGMDQQFGGGGGGGGPKFSPLAGMGQMGAAGGMGQMGGVMGMGGGPMGGGPMGGGPMGGGPMGGGPMGMGGGLGGMMGGQGMGGQGFGNGAGMGMMGGLGGGYGAGAGMGGQMGGLGNGFGLGAFPQNMGGMGSQFVTNKRKRWSKSQPSAAAAAAAPSTAAADSTGKPSFLSLAGVLKSNNIQLQPELLPEPAPVPPEADTCGGCIPLDLRKITGSWTQVYGNPQSLRLIYTALSSSVKAMDPVRKSLLSMYNDSSVQPSCVGFHFERPFPRRISDAILGEAPVTLHFRNDRQPRPLFQFVGMVQQSLIPNQPEISFRIASIDVPMCLIKGGPVANGDYDYMVLMETRGPHRCKALHVLARGSEYFFQNYSSEVIQFLQEKVRTGDADTVRIMPNPEQCEPNQQQQQQSDQQSR